MYEDQASLPLLATVNRPHSLGNHLAVAAQKVDQVESPLCNTIHAQALDLIAVPTILQPLPVLHFWTRGMKSPPRGRSMRGKLSQPTSPAAEEPKSPVDGSKLWNRVASAAGLTVSVSKAWAANIVTYSGEDTPPGKESRLTRAMKAYHLSKASSPADLPPWLFEPHERRAPTTKSPTSSMRSPTSRSPTAKSPTSSLQYNSDDEPISPPQPRGFRDIYDAAQKNNAAKAPIGRMTDSAAPSKATDRLKALRDAKRSALTGGNNNNVVAQPDQTSSTIETNRPRMGLPSGPRRV
ncbi:hypothetical protein C8J56DRAFT_1055788 [Mycena floridula]|nr:hypothetical protein C8J56DRAFT_1055788 [Mycena floridula]